MSRKARQRLREAARQQSMFFAKKSNFLWIFPLTVAVIAAPILLAWYHLRPQKVDTIPIMESSSFEQPKTLNDLLTLSPAELAHCDIARLNLLCAEGLPGAENLKVDEPMQSWMFSTEQSSLCSDVITWGGFQADRWFCREPSPASRKRSLRDKSTDGMTRFTPVEIA